MYLHVIDHFPPDRAERKSLALSQEWEYGGGFGPVCTHAVNFGGAHCSFLESVTKRAFFFPRSNQLLLFERGGGASFQRK